MKKPKVSICIPNYNYENHIQEAVESALAQTYENIEVIVSDNASTDGSLSKIENYEQTRKISVHRNKKNVGIAENHNISVSLATGDYICLLSSDDILKPQFVESSMSVFQRLENDKRFDVGLVFSEKDAVDSAGNISGLPPFYGADFVCKGESHAKVAMMGNPCPPSFWIFKKKAFLKTDGFKEIYGTAHDWGLMFDLNMVSDIAYISEPLGYYRIHENISSSTMLNFKYICNIHILKMDIAEKAKKSAYLSKFIEDSIMRIGDRAIKFGLQCLKSGYFDAARKYMAISVLYDENYADSPVYKAVLVALSSKDPIKYILDAEKTTISVKPRTEPYDFPKDAVLL